MNVLVIGNGGREHALAWKIAQSSRVAKVFVAPGNAGTAGERELSNVALSSIADLVAFAQREHVGVTVVGPEGPLADGVVDAFRRAGLRIFGPTQAAAQLESSKHFAKSFMARHGIPTADYETFTDAAEAHAYVDARGTPIVVKADGLAAGKGVIVATSAADAHAAIDATLVGAKPAPHQHGAPRARPEAPARIVIEAFLTGEEASFIVMADGSNVLPLASSQDHKRLKDGDEGPNTGGMGAYSPAPVVTPAVHARVMREIIVPAVEGMAADGIPYSGFLYAGVMVDDQGNPRALEFNCRLGDPETQPIMMRLKTDFVDLLEQAIDGTLDGIDADWDRRAALGVVLATAGYPAAPRSGDAISGLDDVTQDDCKVFHASTAQDGGSIVTAGGRVLCVTALGETLRLAQRAAYAAVAGIHFEGMQYRTDIGHRALGARKS